MITIEDITRFCKMKGFVYQNSEIYNPMSGFWDYGPLGVELKNNIKNSWWNTFVRSREDVVGIEGAIIADKKLWEASGHATGFADLLVSCKKCNSRFRADQLIEDILKMDMEGASVEELDKIIKKEGIKCSKCKGELGKVEKFNLMFKTNVGPIESESSLAFLRPETCGLIFTNFKLVYENSRQKLPFGIAQIGKAFRNEISPRDFLFRCREFEQMEIEFFVHPDKVNECHLINEVKNLKINLLAADAQEKGKKEHASIKVSDFIKKNLTNQWHIYWLAKVYEWFLNLGIRPENLRLRQHLKEKLAHYASACFDIEYKFPFGWKEIHGNADRGQFDLNQHMKYSKKDLSVFNPETKEKIVPRVAAEPSQGVDRAFLTFLFDAYNYDEKRGNIVLKLHPKLAPIQMGIFPLLSNKPELVKKARDVYTMLKDSFTCFYDSGGSIGRKYSRGDEIGIILGCTIDFETLEKDTITLRDRDTTEQVRIKIADLKDVIQKVVNGENLLKLGKPVKTRVK